MAEGLAGTTAGIPAAGFFDRERIVAKAGFNRWLVPPAGLAIHLSIGMAYGFSVFWVPLSRSIGITRWQACPEGMTMIGRMVATDCDWRISDLGWIYALFFVMLGLAAAIWGGWLERVGPRRVGVASAVCWCGGMVISAFGIHIHQLWLIWLGSGVIGGIGVGLGYISPVSTLIKWFPDRRGLATGMAIMGFGGGAMIGAPLADLLMEVFETPTSVGVWQTFLTMAAIYFVFMMGGALGYRVPPAGWYPEGWTPPADTGKAMMSKHEVHLRDAHKTQQFWLLWTILLLAVCAGIGVVGIASPMIQDIFAGTMIGQPGLKFNRMTGEQKDYVALVSTGFIGLLSVFNIAGRFFWSALSDKLRRKMTYFALFGLGAILYSSIPWAVSVESRALFIIFFCIILSMYGGTFSTLPAYIADLFGPRFVGAIHGRILTAWSIGGIVGPSIVTYVRDHQLAAGVPRAQAYDLTMYIVTALLLAGFALNYFVKPVDSRWHMKGDEVATLPGAATAYGSSAGIGKGGLDLPVILAWLAIGIPAVWGIVTTLSLAALLLK